MTTRIADIKRNDIEACERFYRERKGSISTDEWSMMMKLQDDPQKLVSAAQQWPHKEPEAE